MVEIKPQRSLREGITFTFRGVEPGADELVEIDLVVPPLNFDALKVLEGRIQKFGASNVE